MGWDETGMGMEMDGDDGDGSAREAGREGSRAGNTPG